MKENPQGNLFPEDLDAFLKDKIAGFPGKKKKSVKGNVKVIPEGPTEAEIILQSNEFKAFDQNVQLMVVNDSEHDLVGNVKLENETITFYLHEGMSLNEINNVGMFKTWQNRDESEVVPTFAIVTLNVDPTKQRTCRFFTANEEYIKTTPALESEDYDFDKPHADHSVCMHKKIVKELNVPNPPCQEEQVMSSCGFYESEAFIPLSEIILKKGEQREILNVSDSRVGHGIPVYKIDNDERELTRILHVDTDVDIDKEISDAARAYAEQTDSEVDELMSLWRIEWDEFISFIIGGN